MMRFLKFLFFSYVFLLIVQIRIHNKTIERHVMDWPLSAWLSTQIDRWAHKAWYLGGILVHHGREVYREMTAPESVSPQEAKR